MLPCHYVPQHYACLTAAIFVLLHVLACRLASIRQGKMQLAGAPNSWCQANRHLGSLFGAAEVEGYCR